LSDRIETKIPKKRSQTFEKQNKKNEKHHRTYKLKIGRAEKGSREAEIENVRQNG